MDLYIGTSGFSFKEWKGPFYPDDIANDQMLAYYAERLPAVEINNTFYRLPKASVLEGWAAQTPESFRFSIKASKRITHIKRLKDAGDETTYLLDTVQALGERLGVVLFQIPPNLKKDLPRLEAFLDLMTPTVRPVLEVRHDSWLEDDVLDLLRARRCALCVSDTDEAPDPELYPTAPWGYLRLRRENYDDKGMKAWLKRIREQGEGGWEQAYVFFKHEDAGAGPKLAGRMLELAGKG
jgi:uncharacterized protein YecE (DUF72 family)